MLKSQAKRNKLSGNFIDHIGIFPAILLRRFAVFSLLISSGLFSMIPFWGRLQQFKPCNPPASDCGFFIPKNLLKQVWQIFRHEKTLQKTLLFAGFKSLAEREGFEPSIPFWSIHTFQACSLNRSDISPGLYLICRGANFRKIFITYNCTGK